VVGAKRGPRGGYHLAKPALEIRLGDVVRALEGPIAITGASEPVSRQQPADGKDVTDAVFRELSQRIEGCFDDVTIADMCRRGEDLGLRKRTRERQAYVI
jgi:Rrf2 family protein